MSARRYLWASLVCFALALIVVLAGWWGW